jgi:Domain of unknown function (DUF932)
MMAGAFRHICVNGLIVGNVIEDLRLPHKGDIQHAVIDGAFRVLNQFETVDEHIEAMKNLPLAPPEQKAFATAALALRFGDQTVEEGGGNRATPVTAEQLNQARRSDDVGSDLWRLLQRVSENILRGGLPGRSAQGRRLRTRPVGSIDRGVSLNRALWMLAEEMRQIKAH